METENTQSLNETSVAETTTQNTPEAAPQNNGKGKLLPEIGMGLLGGIGAIILACLITQLVYLLPIHDNPSPLTGYGFLFFVTPVLALLAGVPLVAEGVRFAGKRTGGHGKRKGCYIDTIIATVIVAIIYFALLFGTTDGVIIIIGIPLGACLFLAFSVIGYRKDASK